MSLRPPETSTSHPTPSVPLPADLPTIPDTEYEWEYDNDVELDVDDPAAAPMSPTAPNPMSQATWISKDAIFLFPTDPATPPPDVHPCDTPNEYESLQDITSDKIYHLFGNRRFRNYEHFGRTSNDAKFAQGGELCTSIGKFSNLCKRACSKDLAPTNHYLYKVHLDIFFGDTTSNLGYRYAILLVDRSTKYIWFYSVKSLVSECIIEALEKFRADAGSLPNQFLCD